MDEVREDAIRVETAVSEFLATADTSGDDLVVARGKVFDAGLARVEFPEELGGRGWPREAQNTVNRLLREGGIEPMGMAENPIGFGMGAPTVLEYGHASTKRQLLREIFTGEGVWCQMFSEPSAGSDVAGLSTRAVRDGDNWVINGQKMWTSYAHKADYGMLLARTDPTMPKHEGLTYFFIDMHAPGVEVRPIFQITGEAEFNEIFLTDVIVPDSHLLGSVGGGWKVATTTLMNERDAIGGLTSYTDRLLEQWRRRSPELGPLRDGLRDELVQLWIEDVAVGLTSDAGRRRAAAGRPGPEGSVAKLVGAELQQRISSLQLELEGLGGLTMPEGYPLARDEEARGYGSAARSYLATQASTIAGGTSHVMRNIIAERILRMPADFRVDKGIPWEEIPRG